MSDPALSSSAKGDTFVRKLSMIVVIVALASFQKPAMAQEEAASDGLTGAEIAALTIIGAASNLDIDQRFVAAGIGNPAARDVAKHALLVSLRGQPTTVDVMNPDCTAM